MATLPAFLKKNEAPAASPQGADGAARRMRAVRDPFQLRALPHEHLFLYNKRIDNSRLVREADPKSRGACWSAIGAACVLAILLTSAFAPSVATTIAGYKLEALRTGRAPPDGRAPRARLAASRTAESRAAGPVGAAEQSGGARARAGVAPRSQARRRRRHGEVRNGRREFLTLCNMVERRLTILALIVLLWGAGHPQNLIKLQIVQHEAYAKQARTDPGNDGRDPRAARLHLRPRRPSAGHEPGLAHGLHQPLKVDVGVASDLLGQLLHLDRAELYLKIKQAADAHRGYLSIKRELPTDEYENLLHLKTRGMDWFNLAHESQRHYPNGTLAAHVLGSVDFEENGQCRDRAGAWRRNCAACPAACACWPTCIAAASRRRPRSRPSPGTSLTLTIDERVQFVAEREIAAAVQAHHAESGSVVVMGPIPATFWPWPAIRPTIRTSRSRAGKIRSARMNHAFSVPSSRAPSSR